MIINNNNGLNTGSASCMVVTPVQMRGEGHREVKQLVRDHPAWQDQLSGLLEGLGEGGWLREPSPVM